MPGDIQRGHRVISYLVWCLQRLPFGIRRLVFTSKSYQAGIRGRDQLEPVKEGAAVMDLRWISLESSRSRRHRASRTYRTGIAEVERLEGRALLAITVGPISPSAGMPFTGLVASLDQADVTGTLADINANIDWGDGQSSAGSVSLVGTNYQVQGTHTYAAAGSYPLQVTVTGTPPSQISGQGTATVAATPINLTGVTITPTLGQSFTGKVAVFNDGYTGLTASSYTAIITWSDGHFSRVISSPTGAAVTPSPAPTRMRMPPQQGLQRSRSSGWLTARRQRPPSSC